MPLQTAELKPSPAEIGSELHTALLGGDRFCIALHASQSPSLDVVAEGEVWSEQQGAADPGQGPPLDPELNRRLGQEVGDLRFSRCAWLDVGQLLLQHLQHQLPLGTGFELVPQPLNHHWMTGEAPQTLQKGFLQHRQRSAPPPILPGQSPAEPH